MAEATSEIKSEMEVTFHTQMRCVKEGEQKMDWQFCCGNGHKEYSDAIKCHDSISGMVAGTYYPKDQAEAFSLQKILALKEDGSDLETRLVKHTSHNKLELVDSGEMRGKLN